MVEAAKGNDPFGGFRTWCTVCITCWMVLHIMVQIRSTLSVQLALV
jgi:hypothetical protein